MEVTHINNVLRGDQLLEDNPTQNPTLHIRTLARQIQMMFPRYPLSIIITDLHQSHSMEATIDNILNGQLVLPGGRMDFDDDEFDVNTPPANTRGVYSDDTNDAINSSNSLENIGQGSGTLQNIFSQQGDDRLVSFNPFIVLH